MKKTILSSSLFLFAAVLLAQQNLTPEGLLQMGKLSANGVTKDGKSVVYSVRTYDIASNKKTTQVFIQPIIGGKAVENPTAKDLIPSDRISPDGKMSISSNDVKVKKIFGKDIYKFRIV